MTPAIQFDATQVNNLMKDIHAHARRQSEFENSELFKLMLHAFKLSTLTTLSSDDPTQAVWGDLHPSTCALFFQVMSDPPLSTKSALGFEDVLDDLSLSMQETFDKHGLHVVVNWETAEVRINKG